MATPRTCGPFRGLPNTHRSPPPRAGGPRRRTRSPIAIFSITNGCDLRCKGCYAQAGDSPDALSSRKLRDIVREADELGVSFFVIAGGEPLTRPEIVGIARDYPHIVFLLITNGMLLDAPLIERLKTQRNTMPVLRIEGMPVETDARRGHGVHERLSASMAPCGRRAYSSAFPSP